MKYFKQCLYVKKTLKQLDVKKQSFHIMFVRETPLGYMTSSLSSELVMTNYHISVTLRLVPDIFFLARGARTFVLTRHFPWQPSNWYMNQHKKLFISGVSSRPWTCTQMRNGELCSQVWHPGTPQGRRIGLTLMDEKWLGTNFFIILPFLFCILHNKLLWTDSLLLLYYFFSLFSF